MSRKGENIYKRKDGRWEARILGSDGKYRYIYAKTYKEAREKKKNFKQTDSEERKTQTGQCASLLFELWLSGSLCDRVKPSTYENYYRCIKKYVIPFFTGTNKITDVTVRRFVQMIRQTALSEAYKKKILSIFKTALKDILNESANGALILRHIVLPKAENTVVQVFSRKEQRLIENAAMYSGDKRALGVLLCFYTGIRLGELCALKWCDVDLEAGAILIARTVSRTKSFQDGGGRTQLLVGMPKSKKSIRKIPLPTFLIKLAGELKGNCVNEDVFVISGSNNPIDPRTYQKLFKRLLTVAGVKNLKFHTIRHTFATRALELGVDIKTISEILGHADVSITLNVYAHSLMEQKKMAMEKLNELYITHSEIA